MGVLGAHIIQNLKRGKWYTHFGIWHNFDREHAWLARKTGLDGKTGLARKAGLAGKAGNAWLAGKVQNGPYWMERPKRAM